VPPEQPLERGRSPEAMTSGAAPDEATPTPATTTPRAPRPPDVEVPVVRTAAGSVRPPDLEPDTVRGAPDPLAGWDVGVPAPVVDDRPPFPADTVVVCAATLLGGLAGGLVAERPGRGAVLGALGGLLGASVIRRIWQLPG
jgi:hypothetical protein